MADRMTRWLGGSPLAVLGWLILVSILVGVLLAALGLDPVDIMRSVERLFRSIWNIGFDAFHWLWRYFLLGAVIVIPIWLIMRLLKTPQSKMTMGAKPEDFAPLGRKPDANLDDQRNDRDVLDLTAGQFSAVSRRHDYLKKVERKKIGIIFTAPAILIYIVAGLWGMYICVSIVQVAFGTVAAIVSFVLAPALLGLAPLYAGIVNGDWFPALLVYGSTIVASILFGIGVKIDE